MNHALFYTLRERYVFCRIDSNVLPADGLFESAAHQRMDLDDDGRRNFLIRLLMSLEYDSRLIQQLVVKDVQTVCRHIFY